MKYIIPKDAMALRYTGQNDSHVTLSPTTGTNAFCSKIQFRKNGKPVFDPIDIPELSQSFVRAAVDMSDYDDEVEFLR